MSKFTKEELENMLEDVVNELDLSIIPFTIANDTSPSELVRIVLKEKDKLIITQNR